MDMTIAGMKDRSMEMEWNVERICGNGMEC